MSFENRQVDALLEPLGLDRVLTQFEQTIHEAVLQTCEELDEDSVADLLASVEFVRVMMRESLSTRAMIDPKVAAAAALSLRVTNERLTTLVQDVLKPVADDLREKRKVDMVRALRLDAFTARTEMLRTVRLSQTEIDDELHELCQDDDFDWGSYALLAGEVRLKAVFILAKQRCEYLQAIDRRHARG